MRHSTARCAGSTVLVLLAALLLPTGAARAEATNGKGLVIAEAFGGGGLPGAVYNTDFIDLYNPTGKAIALDGLAISYRSAQGDTRTDPAPLSGTVPAHRHFLIRMSGAHKYGAPIPDPDFVATPKQGMSSRGGQVLLLRGTAPFTLTGDLAGEARIVDMVGIGRGSNSFEGAPAVNTNPTVALTRSPDGKDTDDNRADFALAYPAPIATEPPSKTAIAIWTTPASARAGSGLVQLHASLHSAGAVPTGSLVVRVSGRVLRTVPLAADGSAVTTVGPFPHAGRIPLSVHYSGDSSHQPVDANPWMLPVTKAATRISVASPHAIHRHHRRTVVRVRLSAPGVALTGTVRFRLGHRVWVHRVRSGVARLRLPQFHRAGRYWLRIRFLGSNDARAVHRKVLITVRR